MAHNIMNGKKGYYYLKIYMKNESETYMNMKGREDMD